MRRSRLTIGLPPFAKVEAMPDIGDKWPTDKWPFTEVGWRYSRVDGGPYLIDITQESGGSTVRARFTVDPRWLKAIEEPVDAR
jgi:hypothetical protein